MLQQLNRNKSRISILLFASLASLMFSMYTHVHISKWKNDGTLWQHCLDVDRKDWRCMDRYVEYIIKTTQYGTEMDVGYV